LEDLTPFIEAEGTTQDELASMYADFAWNESTYEGGVYSLPFDTDARMLFYRRDLLEAAGIDLEPLDSANGPITPETYREIAFALNESDESGAYTRLGALPWSDQGWHVTWGFAFGGQFTDGVCEVTPTNKGVVDGYQFLYDFAEALEPARASAFESTYIPRGQPPQQHPFLQGRLAMTISGTFFDDTIRDVAPDLDYGITYIPSATDEPFSWSGGFSLAIPEGAENPEAAYRFIRFATGEIGQRLWAGETGRMPTLESLLADASVLGVNADFYDDLLEVSQERFALPVAARYWDELTAAQEAVVLNDQTAESALERVLSRVQPRLDRLCNQ
jgi:multiple sugar transport system substrate-binding protein